MRALSLLAGLILAAVCTASQAQETVTMRYIGRRYQETMNKSFKNEELVFLKNNDTLLMNIKLPFDAFNPRIFAPGVYYDCRLIQNVDYTFTIKKISVKDLPENDHSYYKINARFSDDSAPSRFTQVKKNTKYASRGNYGKYVDINNELYEITALLPDGSCIYPY